MEFKGRGAERVQTDNLLAFTVIAKEGQPIYQGMAKTLNISRSGIALEYNVPFEKGFRIELTIGMGAEVVKTTGTIMNVAELTPGIFQIGVQFDFLTEEDLNAIAMVYPSILQ